MPWTVLTFEPDPNPRPRAVACDNVDAVLDAISTHVFDYEEARARDGQRFVRGRAPGATPPTKPSGIVLRVAPAAGLTSAQRESLRERLREEGPNFDLTIAYVDSGLDA
jgi:hypothetical protein